MPKRSSKRRSEDDDPNVTAFDVVKHATENDDLTGPRVLADIIASLREGIEAGWSDSELSLRLWPRLAHLVGILGAEQLEELNEGFQRWQEARHENAAAELGRKGGKKGGKARAAKLTPERRSEIARKAAEARWKKGS